MTANQLPEQTSASNELSRPWHEHTPARVWVGHSGTGYRSRTQLELRRDHAAAVDAVRTELEPWRDLGEDFIRDYNLFEVQTSATSKEEYLLHPGLGRVFDSSSRELLIERCRKGADLQILVGDGLSAMAVAAQVPRVLPGLMAGAAERGWSCGNVFIVRHCRVGILNEVGELLDPGVIVLLIGERPGLATATSLSAYLAFRPRTGHTDAQRNLISNIHDQGVRPDDAVQRILNLAAELRSSQRSGFDVKERVGSDFNDRRIEA